MSYKVTAPLVIIANADGKGGDWYGYVGAIVPQGLNDERCKQLAKEGMLEKVSASTADDSSSNKSDKVEDILNEVGDDKDKAAAALAAERESRGDKARKTLVEPLEAIIGSNS